MVSPLLVRRACLPVGVAAIAVACVGCGLQRTAPATQAVAASPVTTAPTTTAAPSSSRAPEPRTVYVVPGAPQVSTQYVPYPSPSYSPNYTPPTYGSTADADFLSRLRAEDIVTPGDAQEVSGGRTVCYNLTQGSDITTEANRVMSAPYYYKASLAGYFAGEAIKVYCPQFSYQLK